jgi:DNA-directed RNA polymerase specialized sigma24 family protein
VKEVLPDVFDQDRLRELAPQLLGAVVRRFREPSMTDDAVQEAMFAACPGGKSSLSRRIHARVWYNPSETQS